VTGFDDLMSEVAERQRAELQRLHLEPEVARRIAAAGDRLAPPVRARRHAGWRWRLAGAGALGLAAAVALLLAVTPAGRRLVGGVLTGGDEPRLSFAVALGNASHPGGVGEGLTGRAGEPATATFSDGSQVVVGAGARARVAALESDGASIVVEEGQVDVHVVHRDKTRWRVIAGDYVVRVTGTRFAVDWQPEGREVVVRLDEGSVEVSGPGLGSSAARVHTGQRLRATPAGATVSAALPGAVVVERAVAPAAAADLEPLASARVAGPTDAPAAVGSTPAAAKTGMPRTRRRTLSPDSAAAKADAGIKPARPADWRELAAGGRYHEALGLAVAGDVDSNLRRLAAGDLLLLGDLARLDGDASRADRAYGSALDRFPSLDRPAFALGVTAFELRHDYPDATRWFSRYLREHPSGPLATEAAGRLVESLYRAGDRAGARAAAAAYLRDHPGGPHAALARSLATQAP